MAYEDTIHAIDGSFVFHLDLQCDFQNLEFDSRIPYYIAYSRDSDPPMPGTIAAQWLQYLEVDGCVE